MRITGLLVAAMLLLLGACAPAPKQASVEVSCDDFYQQQHISKEVEVAVGGTMTVTLCSNPSTGFIWSETAQISDQGVLQQTDHKLACCEMQWVLGFILEV